MLRTLLCSLYCFIVTGVLYGQEKPDTSLAGRLDQLIAARLEQVAPGAVVLVAQQGKVSYRKAFGWANKKQQLPMQPEMIFRIGSVTKPFTATAILQLVEQGKLSLQDSIQRYVPEYPSKGAVITIQHLLTHTSGIKNYAAIYNPAKARKTYTLAQGIDYIREEPLEFTPGSNYAYSNSNYYLLGYILEKITGLSYESYLQQHIFDKAGLLHTRYSNPGNTDGGLVTGYMRSKGVFKQVPLEEITTMYAAGGLEANVDDLLHFQQALYKGVLLNNTSLLAATTPYRFPDGTASQYGYGWFIQDIGGSKAITHSGSTDGFQSDIIYLPEQDVFVAALFNGYEADMDWTVLTTDIARLAIGKPLEDSILSPTVLESYVGVYQYTTEHQLIITREADKLFVKASNPAARLPLVQLHAAAKDSFYIKEAPLRFVFVREAPDKPLKLVTYNTRGKDAEWVKIK
ncbi:serine hydrolase domain-containing protein [Chitinophaga nivalis]|uniref:Beta-lactamase family protein n=1 Tax=Chitinophaga nivalis TaxID=2991709 RepID=A0ABT3IH10_9BACT|nr:serine hydrolase domain-containing protein [Chitinophaga nivalis]MCW3467056.1 beta-lactamase family protein [Chitinophaga nivalis]MCW3483253.1 beta-lactamase family protein [Chitinophaga nivalis]